MRYKAIPAIGVKAIMEGLEQCRRDAQISLRAAGIGGDGMDIQYWTAAVATLDAVVERLRGMVGIPEEKSDFSCPIDG